jgi:energy-coupling factor transporter ATP-binding protein EcfA2
MSNPITIRASDRGILIGANGTGKSTLANYLLGEFRRDYPDGRIMVCDTKPRWRAERLADGTSPRRMYRPLAEGDSIPGAVSLQREADWPLAWDHDTNPTQTVIVQDMESRPAQVVIMQTRLIERYFKTQKASRPSLLYIDEGHDFFHATSQARGASDIVQRCYRAGRERGLASLIGFQRPTGFNLQCLTEANYAALFRINNAADVKRLWDMGWPRDEGPPTYAEPHVFKLWREGRPEAPRFRLKVREGKRRAS